MAALRAVAGGMIALKGAAKEKGVDAYVQAAPLYSQSEHLQSKQLAHEITGNFGVYFR